MTEHADTTADVIAILGCRVMPNGEPSATLARRIDLGFRAWQAGVARQIIACGGQVWHGVREADAIGEALIRLGVPVAQIQRERDSRTTRENARYAVKMMQQQGSQSVWLATCSWHTPRALRCFRRHGVQVHGPASHWYREPPTGMMIPWRERVRGWADQVLNYLGSHVVWLLWMLAATLPLACREPSATKPTLDFSVPVPAATSASVVESVVDEDPAERLQQLQRVEYAREVGGIVAEDLADRRVTIRRAAVRALARLRQAAADPLLLRALSDEDAEVVRWAAYGLGEHCASQRAGHVNALVVAAARWPTQAKVAQAIVRAMGRCAAPASESILIRWARDRGPYHRPAIHALGDLARAYGTLREDSLVALLQLASGDAEHPAQPEAFYPLGQAERLPLSVQPRVMEVAKKRMLDGGMQRRHVIRALGLCGDGAVPLLEAAVLANALDVPARAAAVRGLERLGVAGQRALAKVLEARMPAFENASTAGWLTAEYGVWLALVKAMTRIGKARGLLKRVAMLVPPDNASAALQRRYSGLRCAAAQLLAERDYVSPLVRRCDVSLSEEQRAREPWPASLGARTVVAAIGMDGTKIRGGRLKAWRRYARKGDARSRALALRQLAGHDEIKGAAAVLAAALQAKEPSVVVAAAKILVSHPQRAAKAGGDVVDPAVQKALVAAVAATTDRQTLAQLIDAAAALSVTVTVPAFKPMPVDMDALRQQPLRLRWETDVGALYMQLDPQAAPVAVTRVAQWVADGAYNGVAWQRVKAGFAAWLDPPAGDLPPWLDEPSPQMVAAGAVGMALAGRDTGSHQLFVMHAAFPHMNGRSTLIGRAEGAWDALVDGDVVYKVTRVEEDP